MNLRLLKQYCINKIQEYPMLKEEISDFYYLAQDEIDEGGSEVHECNLAVSSIDTLISEHNTKIKELELELKQLKGKYD